MLLDRSLLIGAVLLSLLAPRLALAQTDADKATARQLASDAQDAFDKKDFATAADKFTRADALYHAPTLVLGIARSQVGLRHFVAAQEAYTRVIRDGAPASAPPAFKKAVDEAKKELDAIASRVAWVTITVTGPDKPVVKLDGFLIPVAALGVRRAVDPGQHSVSASGVGFGAKEQTFTLSEGGNETVALAPPRKAGPTADLGLPAEPISAEPVAPQPAAAGSSRKTLGFVALGVGVVGVGLGAVTGILALGKHGTLADACPNGCPPSAQSDIDGYHTMGLLSTVGFIAGGVGLAAGAVLLITAPKADAAPKTTSRGFVSPYVGPGTLGALGRF